MSDSGYRTAIALLSLALFLSPLAFGEFPATEPATRPSTAPSTRPSGEASLEKLFPRIQLDAFNDNLDDLGNCLRQDSAEQRVSARLLVDFLREFRAEESLVDALAAKFGRADAVGFGNHGCAYPYAFVVPAYKILTTVGLEHSYVDHGDLATNSDETKVLAIRIGGRWYASASALWDPQPPKGQSLEQAAIACEVRASEYGEALPLIQNCKDIGEFVTEFAKVKDKVWAESRDAFEKAR